MLPRWFQAMLMVLFEAWSARRDTQIRFLKLQVEMLRQRLPGNRVIVSPEERSRLLKLGVELNHQVDDLRVPDKSGHLWKLGFGPHHAAVKITPGRP